MICSFFLICFLSNSPLEAQAGEKLQKITEERIKAARRAYEACLPMAKDDPKSHDQRLYLLSTQILDAELSLTTKQEDKVKAFDEHLFRMVGYEDHLIKMSLGGKGQDQYSLTARCKRLEAQYWLEKAKSELPK